MLTIDYFYPVQRARKDHHLVALFAKNVQTVIAFRGQELLELGLGGGCRCPKRIECHAHPLVAFVLQHLEPEPAHIEGIHPAVVLRLARQAFLVVTDMTGAAATSRIRAAAAIERTELEQLFAARITQSETLSFDASSASIRARRIRQYGALRLSDEPIPVNDLAETARLLAEAAARRGLDLLPWSREQKAWRARANFLRGTLGDDWPDLHADALVPSVEQWLAPALYRLTKLSEITGEHLRTALDLLLPYGKRQEIEALLPSHFTAPTGNAVPIDYSAENGPVIEIRVQELFGLTRHPTIAQGRIRLLLVLLSPAHRPIQTTRDLVGFWNGSWADVAKDLKGRYPRHSWPDDPARAAPTARAKPRGT